MSTTAIAMAVPYSVGIDIGSTTIKVVVLNQAQEIVYRAYERHFSEIQKSLTANLARLREVVGQQPFSLAITGSAGMGVAQRLDLPFVQEVIACAQAVRRLIPETDTAVELGGEDAKITYFGSAMEQRMNGVCAGGTGAFIDHMAALLGVDAAGLNALAEKGRQVYTIASRCGVFAKTDIQALINDGVKKADIALSIFQAVVNQTIGNLAQGRPLAGHIAFLGGPLYFLSALKERFVQTLGLTPEEVVPAPDGCYFVALGAAFAAENARVDDHRALCDNCAANGNGAECRFNFDDINRRTQRCMQARHREHGSAFVLFGSDEEYTAFAERHSHAQVPRADLGAYSGDLYLGIDAGSTTTKLAAIGGDGQLLYTSYASNGGQALASVVKALADFYSAIDPARHRIAHVTTTGYGEELVKAAIHADSGVVETFAHLTAAQLFCPDVSFVLDIGGQDMKAFYVHNGAIGNITLNEACSAGCGSFIQNFAQGLNLTTSEFAGLAVQSRQPVDLGTRCTVFMNSRVKQAQKDGAALADISAGIAISVIKNALFKVMQLKDVSTLGDCIVVQGGTFYNDAVLRALELLLKKDVIRPDIAGIMGAYGAALIARKTADAGATSTVLDAEALKAFNVRTKSYHCHGCGNQCLVTMSVFNDGNRYYSGNRCERGAGSAVSAAKAPSVYRYKYERLFAHYQPKPGPRGRLGIPRVLNLYEDYPFWYTLFTALGYEVVLSEATTPQTYPAGMSTVPSDALCYPAKLAHGHIVNLLKAGVTKIFYPCVPEFANYVRETEEHKYNCPVVASYAENLRNNIDELHAEGVRFYQPFLPLHDRQRLIERLAETLAPEGIDFIDLISAVNDAYAEQRNYLDDVQNYAHHVLASGAPAVILAGRPYHLDPEINHGIPEMIQSFGLAVLTEDTFAQEPLPADLSVGDQWGYHSRLYRAANYAAEHDTPLIQLSSFGCGLDAITQRQVKDILESRGRAYTLIKLDDVSNLGAARIRVRSLLAARELADRRDDIATPTLPPTMTAPPSTEIRKTILAPQMAPLHFDLLQTTFAKHGYHLVVPKFYDNSVELGLRYVHNDMCYPAISALGQMLAALQSGDFDPDDTSVMLFQTCGPCRATNYLNLMRVALKDCGLGGVPVFACVGKDAETGTFKLSASFALDVLKTLVLGDLVVRLKNRVLPYERAKGSTSALAERSLALCRDAIMHGNLLTYSNLVAQLVREFDELPINEGERKPQVGIVGEILVKYHPWANNHLEDVLLELGAEVVMPDLLNFLEYLAFDSRVKHHLLAGSLLDQFKGDLAIKLLELVRTPAARALRHSKRFGTPHSITRLAAMNMPVSLANLAGEGWFLTAEIIELLRCGVENVVCLQPFGCLPNHITGKGVLHAIRQQYPSANLLPLDLDAGISEVNQLNRIKLMLDNAFNQLERLSA